MKETPVKTISFSESTVGEEEIAAMRQAVLINSLGGDGKICRETEKLLCEMFNVKHALLTTSCTHALELAMLTLEIAPGDEVILPSFTFTSTANAIMRQGARPVFVDIDPDTYNLDPNLLEAVITPRTRCIIPVHYAGQGCDMVAINAIATRHNIAVVEDAAQAVGAYYQNKPLGTLGDMGCFSFHATKNITCGEGGALLTNNTTLAHKAEIIREKGTNRSAFLRGEVDKYTWVDIGSSFVLTDLLASFLRVQLTRTEELTSQRLAIWEAYYAGTADLEQQGLVKRPVFRSGAQGNGHIFALLIQNGKRDEVIARMRARGISCPFHYVPLHSSPFMLKYSEGQVVSLPNTDLISSTLIRLPLYAHLSLDDVQYVLEALHQVMKAL
jgi:dTDP-4-amino-4,6-dideoxygalactose transaminase